MVAKGLVMLNSRMPFCTNITKITGFLLGLSVFWSAELIAQTSSQIFENETRGSESEHRSSFPGDLVDLFGKRVLDVQGRVHRLGLDGLGAAGQLSPFVLIFLDRDCPVSRRYAPDLNEFHRQAQDGGARLYGVLADSPLSAKEAGEFVNDYGFEFPVLWDPSGDLAAELEPIATPEAFVVSPDSELVYRGRLDDRFASLTELRHEITSHDLITVMEKLASGSEIAPRQTEPVGCLFPPWGASLPEQVTFTRHIAPIITANCSECHRNGSVAPFPLESFEQIKRRSQMIEFVTAEGIMPPWPASKGVGHFRDERHLSDRQKALLSAWVKQGTPRGDPEEILPPTRWPSKDWLMGEPDLVIEMEQDFHIPAGGDDIYRYFVIPVELHEDQQIVGLEFRPGDPQAVHHSLVYIDYTGRARDRDAADPEYGFSVFGTGGFMDSLNPGHAIYLGGWSPGIDPIDLPPGHGVPLKGRSGDAVFEVHYRPTGKPTKDRSRIGLYFAKEPISHIVAGTVAGTLDVDIAPEDSEYWRQVYMDVPADIKLIGVSPHMHYLGKEVKAVATLPDGSDLPLLHIEDWNFRWQNVYVYRQPLEIPTGSRINAWFKFDNSSQNPSNPHVPPGRVRWGWSSDQEMCELWMRFVAKDAQDRELVRHAGNQSWRRPANVTRMPPN